MVGNQTTRKPPTIEDGIVHEAISGNIQSLARVIDHFTPYIQAVIVGRMQRYPDLKCHYHGDTAKLLGEWRDRAMTYINKFEFRSPLSQWLTRIAINVVKDGFTDYVQERRVIVPIELFLVHNKGDGDEKSHENTLDGLACCSRHLSPDINTDMIEGMPYLVDTLDEVCRAMDREYQTSNITGGKSGDRFVWFNILRYQRNLELMEISEILDGPGKKPGTVCREAQLKRTHISFLRKLNANPKFLEYLEALSGGTITSITADTIETVLKFIAGVAKYLGRV